MRKTAYKSILKDTWIENREYLLWYTVFTIHIINYIISIFEILMFEFETQTKNCIKGSLYSNSVFLKKKKKIQNIPHLWKDKRFILDLKSQQKYNYKHKKFVLEYYYFCTFYFTEVRILFHARKNVLCKADCHLKGKT